MPSRLDTPSWRERLRELIIGEARSPHDHTIFHKLSLIAFFAWIGLGADGLSSSAYGPEEAFRALQGHTHLGLFVALAAALTILVISASYSQIIELFPTGGGGYLVASKLLSPAFGMISGCALIIDYVLTITISIASGADALFSFLPGEWKSYKLAVAIAGVLLLTLLNLRGVKESVLLLTPIFLIFVLMHAFGIAYALLSHITDLPGVIQATQLDVQKSHSEIGWLGMLLLLLRAYSMGAGTYTGIEAVSNGLPILREPRVKTAKRTMKYMAVSLAFTVVGLMFAYVLYKVEPSSTKTLNAVLFERMTANWNASVGQVFVLVTLLSEAAILFIAAQTGFLDGPRVLANMALDRWFPTRFGMLSDRFVAQNGILLMGVAALVMMLLTQGVVSFLVVLYSINVFVTFVLSQLGMVRHWWRERAKAGKWIKKLSINAFGLMLTTFILLSVIVIKFHEGGWITILVTGSLVAVAVGVKRHYRNTARLLLRLRALVHAAETSTGHSPAEAAPAQKFDPHAKTAVLFVNGFNGLGLHTLLHVMRLFGETFKNFVFVQVGVIDAGNFKGEAELEGLQASAKSEVARYVDFVKREGYYAKGYSLIGIDVVDEIEKTVPKLLERFPNMVCFGGQVVFPRDSLFTRWLHNYTVFAIQRTFYQQGIPFVILPIRV